MKRVEAEADQAGWAVAEADADLAAVGLASWQKLPEAVRQPVGARWGKAEKGAAGGATTVTAEMGLGAAVTGLGAAVMCLVAAAEEVATGLAVTANETG